MFTLPSVFAGYWNLKLKLNERKSCIFLARWLVICVRVRQIIKPLIFYRHALEGNDEFVFRRSLRDKHKLHALKLDPLIPIFNLGNELVDRFQ
jgi:hypothetical protein